MSTKKTTRIYNPAELWWRYCKDGKALGPQLLAEIMQNDVDSIAPLSPMGMADVVVSESAHNEIKQQEEEEETTEKQLSDKIFDTFVTAPAATEAPNIHDWYRSAKKHVKKLYPNHKFIDPFGNQVYAYLKRTDWKTMDDVLAEDGNWEDERNAFMRSDEYDDLLDRLVIPKVVYREAFERWQADKIKGAQNFAASQKAKGLWPWGEPL